MRMRSALERASVNVHAAFYPCGTGRSGQKWLAQQRARGVHG
jgi:hypothetical protein